MNTLTKRLLPLALLTALATAGVSIAQSRTGIDPVVAPVPLPASVGAPAATPAATPPLTVVVPVPPSALGVPDPEVARLEGEAAAQAQKIAQMTSAGSDESAVLREVSRYQAKLSLINIASKIEKAQQEQITSRAKFQVEQAKTAQELATATAPVAPVRGSPLPGALPGQASNPGVAGGFDSLDTPPPPFNLIGVSSFGGKSVAELNSASMGRMTVEVGGRLPDGAKVTAISPTSIVVVRNGKRETLYLSSGPSDAKVNK